MNSMNPKVDVYISKAIKWQKEMEKLRTIVLDCSLTEELKWYQPCYSFQKSNILNISGFKEYCAFGFFKGTLLKDANGILIKPGENTQVLRQEGKGHTFFIFLHSNNSKLGSQGLKNVCRKFSMDRD